MPTDIASLLLGVTLKLVTMAAALPVVTGPVNRRRLARRPGSRCRHWDGPCCWRPGRFDSGGVLDRLLSTLSMAGLAFGQTRAALERFGPQRLMLFEPAFCHEDGRVRVGALTRTTRTIIAMNFESTIRWEPTP